MELVFPKNNEEVLVAEALKLGFSEDILCYKELPKKLPEIPKTKIAILLNDRKKVASLKKKADLLL
jgi:hypothetical protein